MPLFIGLLLLISGSPDSRADADQPRRFFDRIFRNELVSVLVERCHQYGANADAIARCQILARDVPAALGITPSRRSMFSPSSNAYFSMELQDLIRSDGTARYLEDLVTGLNNGEDLDLWASTLRYTRGDRPAALRLIAVLFQDTSTTSPAITYLQKQFWVRHSASFRKTISLLSQANALLRHPLIREHAKFYPPELPAALNRRDQRFNHFYTIAYLTHKLAFQTSDTENAFLVPVVLNSVYGIAASIYAPDDPSVREFRRKLHEDPHAIEITGHEEMLDDTYLGYAGALFATDKIPTLMSVESFTTSYAASPSGLLTQLACEHF